MTLPVTRHRLWQLIVDGALIAIAWYAAWNLRFDELRLPRYYEPYISWQAIGLVVALKLGVFILFGFYNRWWRYVSTRDMWGAARGVVAASVLAYLVFYFVPLHDLRVPRAVALLDTLLLLALVAASRLLARTLIERPAPGGLVARGREVIVVGAGDAGQLIIRELQKTLTAAAADGERIELVHSAADRGIYARGAVKAALWARGKGPGLFNMMDVLGIESAKPRT